MTRSSPEFGLQEIGRSVAPHAIVVLHGIRQTAEAVRPLARTIKRVLAGSRVFVYGYDHTRGLTENGKILDDIIREEFPTGRVDLVGYSMGGLVARLAASEEAVSSVHTVVTLATPNRGALSNAELTSLGQVGRQGFEMLSPLLPRSAGVKDLTRVRGIMKYRRERLMAGDKSFTLDGDSRRYVSIPALWYSIDKANFQFGPSIAMSGLVAALNALPLQFRLEAMQKSHDGIVTERSNNLALAEGNDWAEFHLAKPGPSDAPPLCHAVVEVCDQHDHMSILQEEEVARLICALIDTPDWRHLKAQHPEFVHARLHPFDV